MAQFFVEQDVVEINNTKFVEFLECVVSFPSMLFCVTKFLLEYTVISCLMIFRELGTAYVMVVP